MHWMSDFFQESAKMSMEYFHERCYNSINYKHFGQNGRKEAFHGW